MDEEIFQELCKEERDNAPFKYSIGVVMLGIMMICISVFSNMIFEMPEIFRIWSVGLIFLTIGMSGLIKGTISVYSRVIIRVIEDADNNN